MKSYGRERERSLASQSRTPSFERDSFFPSFLHFLLSFQTGKITGREDMPRIMIQSALLHSTRRSSFKTSKVYRHSTLKCMHQKRKSQVYIQRDAGIGVRRLTCHMCKKHSRPAERFSLSYRSKETFLKKTKDGCSYTASSFISYICVYLEEAGVDTL